MVRKFISLLYKETHSLNQAALLLGIFSFLSQFLGFLRDRLLAHIFGASAQLDIYYAAFRIPDFLFVTVASIVSLSVLVPFIVEKDAKGREELRNFIDNIFSFFSFLMIGVALVTFLLLPWLAHILFKGMSSEEVGQVVHLSRLLLISPVVLGLSNLFGSLTQAFNRFVIYAFAPVLYNSGIVLGILWFSNSYGTLGAVIGVIVGAICHLLIQVPFVWKIGLMPRAKFKLDWSQISKVVTISLPRTLTLSMSSLTFIALVSLASRMAKGSVSILNFANDIQTISLSLIGVSYSLAAFPTLTRKFQEKDFAAFIQQMQFTTRFIIFWSLPFTAIFVVLRAQIVRVLLGSGLFDWTATRLTAAALALFVFSTVFQSLILLFMRGFYSAGFTKKPFVINLISTLILIVSTYGLIELFYHSTLFNNFITALLKVDDVGTSEVLMLPLGFTIGTIVNGILLWVAFEKEFEGFTEGIWRTVFEGLGASTVMGAVTYFSLSVLAHMFNTATLLGIFLQGFLSGIFGIAAGVAVLLILQSQELKSIWKAMNGKFWKTRALATDPEIV